MRILRLGFWWLLVPVAVLCGLLAFLLLTTQGARLLVAATERLLPSLQVEQLEGSVAHGLSAHRVVWSQPEVTVTLDGVAAWWDPQCLLQARICVHSLVAGSLLVDVAGGEADESREPADITPIDLPVLMLPWRLQLERFYLAELHVRAGGRLTTINPVTFQAEWLGTRLALEDLRVAMADAQIGALEVTLSGVLDMVSAWPFHLVVNADYVPPLEGWQSQQLSVSGEGNVRQLLLQGEVSAQFAVPEMAPLRLRADLSTQALDSELHLRELHGEWNTAPLFAQGHARVYRSGELELDDMLLRWGDNQATLNGRLRDEWDVRARLALREPQLLAPEATGELEGEAHVSGARDDPLITAQLRSEQLTLPDIQLEAFTLEANVAPVSFSRLEAHARADIIRVAEDILQAVDVTLQGDASAHRLALQMQRDQQQVQLAADGTLNTDTLDWQGTLTQLQAQLEPDWIVRLRQPVGLQWRQQAREIRWQHHCLQDASTSLCSEGWLRLADLRGDIRLAIRNFELPKLNTLLKDSGQVQGRLDADLHIQEHLLRPRLQGDLQARDLAWRARDAASTTFEQGGIQATFSGQQAAINVQLDIPPGLHWSSDGAVQVDWSGEGLAVRHSCWQAHRLATSLQDGGALGSLCVQAQTTPATGLTAQADLQLALAAALQPFLPPDLLLDGQLHGQARAQLKGRDLQASFQMAVEQGEVQLVREDARESVRAPIEALRLEGRLQQEVLQLALQLQSTRLGSGEAQARIDIRGDTPQLSLDAGLRALNLALLQPLAPQLTELRGAIDLDLHMVGASTAPAVNGRLDIRDVQILSAGVPITVDDLDAQLVFTGDQGQLQGQLTSGSGKAELSGNFVRATAGWQASLHLKGRKIPVQQPPDIRFLMHPDLTLRIDSERLDLGGTILVNDGFLVLQPLPPDAIGVSPDVEFIDERAVPLQEQTAMLVGLDVVAAVEPSLRIRGFGGEMRPKGSVRIQLDRSGVLTGRGTIDIQEGSYTGYGQQLTIRRGQAIFNGPLDQPFINLEAVRQVENVVAGIRVVGPASEPIATLFSEPALPDSQILYYIITGKPPGTGTQDDDTAVRNALLSVGLMGGQPLARDIASKVGIDDLQMGTTGSGDQTAVTLSGYLNSRTYVQYGISVFQPVNTLTVRYRLREKLFLEAVNGIASALDILYSFEF